jgi:anti-sigma factor RsiW
MTQSPVTEAELHAWVDGMLPESRRAEIETWLATRPEETVRLQAYRRHKEELRALFNPVLDEPIPPAMISPPRSWFGDSRGIAASLIFAIVGGAAGWILHEQMDEIRLARAPSAGMTEFARQAAIAHAVYSPEVRHPVEVGADQQDHLVAWLSKRLGSQIQPPKLNKQGYELVGGRLLPGASGPVAQFMYQNASGQRLTVYLSAGKGNERDTGFRFANEGSVNVFYWIDGKFGYAISAMIDKAELTRIATAVHEQLDHS